MLASACGGAAKKSAGPPVPDKEVPSEDELAAEKEAEQFTAITSALNEFGPAVHTCWSPVGHVLPQTTFIWKGL